MSLFLFISTGNYFHLLSLCYFIALLHKNKNKIKSPLLLSDTDLYPAAALSIDRRNRALLHTRIEKEKERESLKLISQLQIQAKSSSGSFFFTLNFNPPLIFSSYSSASFFSSTNFFILLCFAGRACREGGGSFLLCLIIPIFLFLLLF